MSKSIWEFTEPGVLPSFVSISEEDGEISILINSEGRVHDYARVVLSLESLDDLAVAIIRHQAECKVALRVRVQYFEDIVRGIHGEAVAARPNAMSYERTKVEDPNALIESQPGITDSPEDCGLILVDRIAEAPAEHVAEVTEKEDPDALIESQPGITDSPEDFGLILVEAPAEHVAEVMENEADAVEEEEEH
jgi:hypothetical protein